MSRALVPSTPPLPCGKPGTCSRPKGWLLVCQGFTHMFDAARTQYLPADLLDIADQHHITCDRAAREEELTVIA
jgi:hypothetical protein